MSKLPEIRYYIGQKLLVIGGVKCEETDDAPRTCCRRGDLVEVVGVYPHHITVENSYRQGQGAFRECFSLNGIQRDLRAFD